MAREELTRLTGNTEGGNCGQGDCPNVCRTKVGARFPGPYEDAWMAMVRTRNVGRVHIVTRPLTDYLRFEFERC